MIIAYLFILFLLSIVKLLTVLFAVSYTLALIIEGGSAIKRGLQ